MELEKSEEYQQLMEINNIESDLIAKCSLKF